MPSTLHCLIRSSLMLNNIKKYLSEIINIFGMIEMMIENFLDITRNQ